MSKIYPGDEARDVVAGFAPSRTVTKVEDGLVHFVHGAAIAEANTVLTKRGPMHELLKARESDGTYTGKKFKGGDVVKVTGPVPNKGKTGKITMTTDHGHVVTHDDGSHASYAESHLSHIQA